MLTNFKHYYLFFIKGTMKSYFPKAVSYNRFVELESRVFAFIRIKPASVVIPEKEQNYRSHQFIMVNK